MGGQDGGEYASRMTRASRCGESHFEGFALSEDWCYPAKVTVAGALPKPSRLAA
jgi:hypothetical protein